LIIEAHNPFDYVITGDPSEPVPTRGTNEPAEEPHVPAEGLPVPTNGPPDVAVDTSNTDTTSDTEGQC
jgi:hypothetical protein